MVSASHDQTLRVWDPDRGESLRTLAGHSRWVNRVAVLSDGRVVSTSYDKTLRVWDPDSGEALATFVAEEGLYRVAEVGLDRVAFLSGRKTIVAGDGAGRLHFLRWKE